MNSRTWHKHPALFVFYSICNMNIHSLYFLPSTSFPPVKYQSEEKNIRIHVSYVICRIHQIVTSYQSPYRLPLKANSISHAQTFWIRFFFLQLTNKMTKWHCLFWIFHLCCIRWNWLKRFDCFWYFFWKRLKFCLPLGESNTSISFAKRRHGKLF